MKIKTIIIAIICIILPYSSIANQTNANCNGKEYDGCVAQAGCYYGVVGSSQGNMGCYPCIKGYYCPEKNENQIECPKPELQCDDKAQCSTNGYLLSGLESVDECIHYTLLKITLPQAYYFEAPSTLNPNDKAYKTKECSKQTLNGRTYSGKPENADKENSSLTIGELKENYSLQDRCILCEENQVPNDNGIGCKDKESESCPAGRYLDIQTRKCIDCDKGTFQPIAGYMGDSCTTCPEGTYQNEQGKSSCKPCVANAAPGISAIPNLTNIENKCKLEAKNVTDRTSLDACEYTLTSPKGYYLSRGATTGTEYNFKCNLCPDLKTKDPETISGYKGDLRDKVGTKTDGSACSTPCECGGTNNKEGACLINGGEYSCECIEGYHVDGETRDTIYYNPIKEGQKNCVINEYSIEYYCNDDTSNTQKYTIDYHAGHNILPSSICQKKGYTFTGWSEEESPDDIYASGSSIIVDKDYTFIAQWVETTCDPGQYLDSDTLTCKACDKGTFQPTEKFDGHSCKKCDYGYYQSESGQSKCLECEKGSIAPTLGATACDRCDTSTTKGTNDKRTACICEDGFRDPNGPNSETETQLTYCTAATYIVYYAPNCQSDNKLDTKKSEKSYTENETIAYQADMFSCPGYDFSGWKAQNGKTYIQDISVSDVTTDKPDYITLTAQWTPKTFDVHYYKYYNNHSDNELLSNDQGCTYGTTCTAKSAKETQANVKGYLFNAWSCKYMKGKTLTCCQQDNKEKCEIEPGDDISTMSEGNDILLIANFKKCLAGYYCSNNEQIACPAGSTTDAGADSIADSIDDCYMVGGDITRICSNNGGKDSGYNACFYLPGDVKKLFYKGTQI